MVPAGRRPAVHRWQGVPRKRRYLHATDAAGYRYAESARTVPARSFTGTEEHQRQTDLSLQPPWPPWSLPILYQSGECNQRALDPRIPAYRTVQPQTVTVFARRRKHGTRRKADTRIQSTFHQTQCIRFSRQLNPQHKPAGWTTHPRLSRKQLDDAIRHTRHGFDIRRRRSTQTTLVMTTLQEMRQRQLGWCVDRQGIEELQILRLRHLPAWDQPADSHASRQRL